MIDRFAWYCAHVVMSIQQTAAESDDIHLFENIVVVRLPVNYTSDMLTDAIRSHTQTQKVEWNGNPAQLTFSGIRKVIVVDSETEQIQSGTEVTFSRFTISRSDLPAFLSGAAVVTRYIE